MTITRVQNWPFPLDIDNFEAVSEYLVLLYRALQEDSTLRIEDFQSALHGRILGEYNTLLGLGAGYSITTGKYNTLIGRDCGYSITTGEYNLAIGYQALYTATTAGYNSAVGQFSLYFTTTGDQNVAVGNAALYSNTTGYDNVGIGRSAMYSNTTGYNNVGVGLNVLNKNTEGYENVGLGYQALHENTTGDRNVGIGFSAGYSNSTGDGNVFIGALAGYSETGSDKLYIDNSNTATPLIYGDFSTNALTINGTLTVTGDVLNSGSALLLQDDGNQDIHLFASCAEGETKELKIYGHKNGGAREVLEIGVGTDYDGFASFNGVAAFFFDGNIITDSNFVANYGRASGEWGWSLYSIGTSVSKIMQSDAEGIASSSDLRIALDSSLRTLNILTRGDEDEDLSTSAVSHATVRIWNDDISNQLALTQGSITDSSGAISFGDENLTTTGNVQSTTHTFPSEYNIGAKSANFAIDWNDGQKQKVTITGVNLQITFTAPTTGVGMFSLRIIQGDGDDTIDWANCTPVPLFANNGTAITLSTGSGLVDLLWVFWNGTNYYIGGDVDFAPA